jgi:hypothetical protein
MVYMRAQGIWVVVDRISTDRPRVVEGLWHVHPSCTVALTSKVASKPSLTSHVTNNRTRIGLDIIQATGAASSWMNVTLVLGQTKPVLQGWYSPTYGTKVPSPTLVYTSGVGAGVSTYAWLLVPTTAGLRSNATASVKYQNATHVVVAICIPSRAPPPAPAAFTADVAVEIPTPPLL